MSRALRFAVALPTLLVAHNVADHVVQTDHQAVNKASSWTAMAGHVGGYQATQLGALLAISRATDTRLSWRGMLAGGALSAISHAFLDRRWPVVGVLASTGSWNFANPTTRVTPNPDGSGEHVGPVSLHGPYLADQALHHGFLLLAALLIAGSRP